MTTFGRFFSDSRPAAPPETRAAPAGGGTPAGAVRLVAQTGASAYRVVLRWQHPRRHARMGVAPGQDGTDPHQRQVRRQARGPVARHVLRGPSEAAPRRSPSEILLDLGHAPGRVAIQLAHGDNAIVVGIRFSGQPLEEGPGTDTEP